MADTMQQSRASTRGGGFAGRGAKTQVRLMDHLGRTRTALLPRNMPVSQLRDKILDRLQTSPFDTNGNPVAYDLVHGGKVLQDDATLDSVGVIQDDELELSPSIQSA